MKKRRILLLSTGVLLSMIFFLCIGCKDEDEPEPDPVQLPVLSTLAVSDITSTSAASGGNVTDNGGAAVTSRGLVWSTVENPTTDDNDGITLDGEGSGEYNSTMTDLIPYTVYYLRAYATNSKGTAYGNQVEFQTFPEGAYGKVTDIDGNEYWTVAIGENEWMAENLRVTKYSDGTSIPTDLSEDDWWTTTEGAYTVYPFEDTINGEKAVEPVLELDDYGYLYNAFVALYGNPCPEGWYVPSHETWQNSIDFIALYYAIPEDEVGDAIKSCRQVNSPLGGACKTDWHPRWDESAFAYGTNRVFFLALPAGELNPEFGYHGLGKIINWWTSSPNSASFTKRFGLDYNNSEVSGGASRNNYGYSIRCYRPLVK